MLRILLVEDEDNLRQAMREVIDWHALGAEPPVPASDGQDALNRFTSVAPDIVLSDINMPRLSGLEMARQMLEIRPDVKIIFFSAYSDVGFLQQALRMGSVDYLLKPIRVEELAAAIARAAGSLKEAEARRADGPAYPPSLLKNLLLGAVARDALLQQIETASPDHAKHGVCAFFFSGLHDFPDTALGDLIARTPRIGPRSGVLVPLSSLLYCYVYFAAAPLGEAFHEDTMRQWMLKLHLAGCVSAKIAASKMQENLIGLFGTGAAQMEDLIDSQQNELARDAQRAKQLCKAIQGYIQQHYRDRELSAGSVAKAMHYTSAYICTIFRHHRQITIHEFINLYRIARAKQLLFEEELSIAAIAEMTGYENDNYFSRVFKKLEGVSPSDFRREKKR